MKSVVKCNAIAESSPKQQSQALEIDIDNSSEEESTVIKVTGLNKPGLLSALTKTLQNLGLEVVKVQHHALGPCCNDAGLQQYSSSIICLSCGMSEPLQ